jgi:hypothetical protein
MLFGVFMVRFSNQMKAASNSPIAAPKAHAKMMSMGRVRMVSGSDGDGLTTKPGLQMRRVGAEVVRSPITRDTIGAHEHGLDCAHEGLGLHDVLTVSGAKDNVCLHGG